MVLVTVPVTEAVKAWWQAHYGTKPIEVRGNTPIWGPICVAYFSEFDHRNEHPENPNFEWNGPIIQLKFTFVKDLQGMDAHQCERFGFVVESILTVHRLGFADGYTSIKANRSEAVRRYMFKYDLDNLLKPHATLKEVERWGLLANKSKGYHTKKQGFQGGKALVERPHGLVNTII
jgi:hypothetical protein